MAEKAFTQITSELKAGMRAFIQKDFRKAIQLCDVCLKKNPTDVNALNLKGRSLTKTSHFYEAERHLRKAIYILPNATTIQVSMARLQIARGLADAALEILNEVIAKQADFEEALLERGILLERLGQYEKALADLNAINSEGPNAVQAANTRSLLHFHRGQHKLSISETEWIMEHSQPGTAPYRSAAFVQGRAYDKIGMPEQAMKAWKIGNDTPTATFDREEFFKKIEATIHAFPAEPEANWLQSDCRSERPVFIVGMPRSGTTLVEQILSSHDKIYSAGEIRNIERLSASLPRRLQSHFSVPKCFSALDQDTLNDIAHEHLAELDKISPEHALRVVNKNLENYWHVGLLNRMYPKAKFIFIKRDPRDNAMSVYSNWFNPKKFPYAYTTDFGDIGFVYRHIERLMDHWSATLPASILTIRYEDIVRDTERLSKDMINHLDLEWDAKCLDFHRSSRLVLTLSYAQVNKPIYTSSRRRWEAYREHLGELESEIR